VALNDGREEFDEVAETVRDLKRLAEASGAL